MSSKQVDFDAFNRNLERFERTLPRLLGNATLNHTKKAFRDEGFTDGALDPWAKRKTSNKADRATNKQRALLVDSGNLRRSLRVQSATMKEVRVGSYGVPYAARHNRGLAGMPERRFIGPSKVLNEKLFKIIDREYRKVFRI